jgi:glycerophosphoryl diester phosphodiesterase
MCELKVDHSAAQTDTALVDAVLQVVAARRAEAWTAIHSFDPEIVRAARERDRRLSAAIISPPVDAAGLDRLVAAVLKRGAQAISVEHHCVDRALVVAAKRRQVTVWCWTADDAADWERLVTAGVDGIITNVPSRLRNHLGS